jgi:hypothetical protein
VRWWWVCLDLRFTSRFFFGLSPADEPLLSASAVAHARAGSPSAASTAAWTEQFNAATRRFDTPKNHLRREAPLTAHAAPRSLACRAPQPLRQLDHPPRAMTAHLRRGQTHAVTRALFLADHATRSAAANGGRIPPSNMRDD